MTLLANGAAPLSLIGIGQRVRLVAVRGDQRHAHRLTELGLTPGVELEVMCDEGGPLVLAVRDTRLALSRGLAHTVLVEPLP